MTEAGLFVAGFGLTKWYGEQTALDGVDIRLEAGQVHGLLGPNGAGKTTLLSIMFGLVLPDEGTLRLFGRTRGEAGAAWLDGVAGFVESPTFYPYLSGRRNLEILAGLDRGHEASLIGEALDLTGLTGAGGRKVRGYSLGMRQRLGLAAALLRRPRLLILDEPANGMDPAGMRDLRAALRGLAGQGLGVLLSSHDMAQVEGICDSVTVLHEGRVAYTGRLEAMRAAAPDATWRLLTSDDEAALDLAVDAGAVKVARDSREGLVAIGGQQDMDRYVLALAGAGVAVRALTRDVSPLQGLFIHLNQPGGPPASTAEPAPAA